MTAQATTRHRVSLATAQMRAAAASVVDASVWSMDAAETAQTLVELTQLAAQVSELTSRVAAHADDLHVGQDAGASNAANWLAHTTKTTRPTAHGVVKLGHALEAHPQTRDALAHGEVLLDQARVILHAVDQLPDEVDAREAAILEAEERAADRSCHLTMYNDGHGKTHGRFTLPTLEGAALRKMLHALTAPKHLAATGAERLPTPEAMGRAFGELILRIPAKSLPESGGLPATLLVLIDEDSLMGRVEKAGLLDTGERISPALARRLACEAGIIPVVLGGNSQPLDLGRRRRLHTEAQRLAILVRDKGCRAEGCD